MSKEQMFSLPPHVGQLEHTKVEMQVELRCQTEADDEPQNLLIRARALATRCREFDRRVSQSC